MPGFNPPCEACLTEDAGLLPVDKATHVILVEREGVRVWEPACLRHTATALCCGLAHGMALYGTSATPEPEPAAPRIH